MDVMGGPVEGLFVVDAPCRSFKVFCLCFLSSDIVVVLVVGVIVRHFETGSSKSGRSEKDGREQRRLRKEGRDVEHRCLPESVSPRSIPAESCARTLF